MGKRGVGIYTALFFHSKILFYNFDLIENSFVQSAAN
jgi:hypothetical protein